MENLIIHQVAFFEFFFDVFFYQVELLGIALNLNQTDLDAVKNEIKADSDESTEKGKDKSDESQIDNSEEFKKELSKHLNPSQTSLVMSLFKAIQDDADSKEGEKFVVN